jgi:ABC-type lipoprotein export system ATPase subunit
MRVRVAVETATSTSIRARQVSAMFDVPSADKCRLEWDIELPIEAQPWNVGLVVGPSGSGKTTIMRSAWGEPPQLEWNAASVVDDFAQAQKMDAISGALSAVGFNTIPAWMRPFRVLSNGEQFRVDLARRMLELPDPVVVDEFTSVVDRQVAQFGSHAVQKFVRKAGRQFVAVGCHYDVIDWLQPDWVLDMATRQFTRRLVQRRPTIECIVGRLPYAAWSLFAPFHYLTGELHRSARCFGLWANGRLAAFAGMMHMPHPKVGDIQRCSRLVTLPDFQGLGLAMVLIEKVGAAMKGIGKRARVYPAHPALVRSFDASPLWSMRKEAGTMAAASSASSASSASARGEMGRMGARPCGVFEYVGAAMDRTQATRLIAA